MFSMRVVVIVKVLIFMIKFIIGKVSDIYPLIFSHQ